MSKANLSKANAFSNFRRYNVSLSTILYKIGILFAIISIRIYIYIEREKGRLLVFLKMNKNAIKVYKLNFI